MKVELHGTELSLDLVRMQLKEHVQGQRCTVPVDEVGLEQSSRLRGLVCGRPMVLLDLPDLDPETTDWFTLSIHYRECEVVAKCALICPVGHRRQVEWEL